jgi:hypothetical protein
MEYDTTEYQKLQVKQYPARTLRETAEGKYWKQFKQPVVAQQVCKFSPCASMMLPEIGACHLSI